jgi:hypothetical protein
VPHRARRLQIATLREHTGGMTTLTPQSLPERLDSKDPDAVLEALRAVEKSAEIALFLPKLVELLRTGEMGPRFVAARILSEAALHNPDIAAAAIPAIEQLLTSAEVTLRKRAAGLLAKYYFLARQWDAISALLESDSETVCSSALHALDDLAEAADHKDYDLAPVVPSLLSVCARKGDDYKKTRLAAARVLVWLILRQNKMSATSYVINGVDVMGIAEVRAELKTLKRFAAKHREG